MLKISRAEPEKSGDRSPHSKTDGFAKHFFSSLLGKVDWYYRKAIGFPHIGRQSRETSQQFSIRQLRFGVNIVATP